MDPTTKSNDDRHGNDDDDKTMSRTRPERNQDDNNDTDPETSQQDCWWLDDELGSSNDEPLIAVIGSHANTDNFLQQPLNAPAEETATTTTIMTMHHPTQDDDNNNNNKTSLPHERLGRFVSHGKEPWSVVLDQEPWESSLLSPDTTTTKTLLDWTPKEPKEQPAPQYDGKDSRNNPLVDKNTNNNNNTNKESLLYVQARRRRWQSVRTQYTVVSLQDTLLLHRVPNVQPEQDDDDDGKHKEEETIVVAPPPHPKSAAHQTALRSVPTQTTGSDTSNRSFVSSLSNTPLSFPVPQSAVMLPGQGGLSFTAPNHHNNNMTTTMTTTGTRPLDSASSSISLFQPTNTTTTSTCPPIVLPNPFGTIANNNNNNNNKVTPSPFHPSLQESPFQTQQQQQRQQQRQQTDQKELQDQDETERVRDRLVEFYTKHNPSKLHTIDKTLERYRGRYTQLFDKLDKLYTTYPPPQGSGPIVFLEFASSKDMNESPRPHRIIIQLFASLVPRTAENFRALCTGQVCLDGTRLTFRHSCLHRIVKGMCVQGGDFTVGDGTGGRSIYRVPEPGVDLWGNFADETMTAHTRPGLLSMANCGPNTNSSQFFITTAATPHLNGKHVVFGQVLHGMEWVQDVEQTVPVDPKTQRPLEPALSTRLRIVDCGQCLDDGTELRASQWDANPKATVPTPPSVPLIQQKKSPRSEPWSSVPSSSSDMTNHFGTTTALPNGESKEATNADNKPSSQTANAFGMTTAHQSGERIEARNADKRSTDTPSWLDNTSANPDSSNGVVVGAIPDANTPTMEESAEFPNQNKSTTLTHDPTALPITREADNASITDCLAEKQSTTQGSSHFHPTLVHERNEDKAVSIHAANADSEASTGNTTSSTSSERMSTESTLVPTASAVETTEPWNAVQNDSNKEERSESIESQVLIPAEKPSTAMKSPLVPQDETRSKDCAYEEAKELPGEMLSTAKNTSKAQSVPVRQETESKVGSDTEAKEFSVPNSAETARADMSMSSMTSTTGHTISIPVTPGETISQACDDGKTKESSPVAKDEIPSTTSSTDNPESAAVREETSSTTISAKNTESTAVTKDEFDSKETQDDEKANELPATNAAESIQTYEMIHTILPVTNLTETVRAEMIPAAKPTEETDLVSMTHQTDEMLAQAGTIDDTVATGSTMEEPATSREEEKIVLRSNSGETQEMIVQKRAPELGIESESTLVPDQPLSPIVNGSSLMHQSVVVDTRRDENQFPALNPSLDEHNECAPTQNIGVETRAGGNPEESVLDGQECPASPHEDCPSFPAELARETVDDCHTPDIASQSETLSDTISMIERTVDGSNSDEASRLAPAGQSKAITTQHRLSIAAAKEGNATIEESDMQSSRAVISLQSDMNVTESSTSVSVPGLSDTQEPHLVPIENTSSLKESPLDPVETTSMESALAIGTTHHASDEDRKLEDNPRGELVDDDSSSTPHIKAIITPISGVGVESVIDSKNDSVSDKMDLPVSPTKSLSSAILLDKTAISSSSRFSSQSMQQDSISEGLTDDEDEWFDADSTFSDHPEPYSMGPTSWTSKELPDDEEWFDASSTEYEEQEQVIISSNDARARRSPTVQGEETPSDNSEVVCLSAKVCLDASPPCNGVATGNPDDGEQPRIDHENTSDKLSNPEVIDESIAVVAEQQSDSTSIHRSPEDTSVVVTKVQCFPVTESFAPAVENKPLEEKSIRSNESSTGLSTSGTGLIAEEENRSDITQHDGPSYLSASGGSTNVLVEDPKETATKPVFRFGQSSTSTSSDKNAVGPSDDNANIRVEDSSKPVFVFGTKPAFVFGQSSTSTSNGIGLPVFGASSDRASLPSFETTSAPPVTFGQLSTSVSKQTSAASLQSLGPSFGKKQHNPFGETRSPVQGHVPGYNPFSPGPKYVFGAQRDSSFEPPSDRERDELSRIDGVFHHDMANQDGKEDCSQDEAIIVETKDSQGPAPSKLLNAETSFPEQKENSAGSETMRRNEIGSRKEPDEFVNSSELDDVYMFPEILSVDPICWSALARTFDLDSKHLPRKSLPHPLFIGGIKLHSSVKKIPTTRGQSFGEIVSTSCDAHLILQIDPLESSFSSTLAISGCSADIVHQPSIDTRSDEIVDCSEKKMEPVIDQPLVYQKREVGSVEALEQPSIGKTSDENGDDKGKVIAIVNGHPSDHHESKDCSSDPNQNEPSKPSVSNGELRPSAQSTPAMVFGSTPAFVFGQSSKNANSSSSTFEAKPVNPFGETRSRLGGFTGYNPFASGPSYVFGSQPPESTLVGNGSTSSQSTVLQNGLAFAASTPIHHSSVAAPTGDLQPRFAKVGPSFDQSGLFSKQQETRNPFGKSMSQILNGGSGLSKQYNPFAVGPKFIFGTPSSSSKSRHEDDLIGRNAPHSTPAREKQDIISSPAHPNGGVSTQKSPLQTFGPSVLLPSNQLRHDEICVSLCLVTAPTTNEQVGHTEPQHHDNDKANLNHEWGISLKSSSVLLASEDSVVVSSVAADRSHKTFCRKFSMQQSSVQLLYRDPLIASLCCSLLSSTSSDPVGSNASTTTDGGRSLGRSQKRNTSTEQDGLDGLFTNTSVHRT